MNAPMAIVRAIAAADASIHAIHYSFEKASARRPGLQQLLSCRGWHARTDWGYWASSARNKFVSPTDEETSFVAEYRGTPDGAVLAWTPGNLHGLRRADDGARITGSEPLGLIGRDFVERSDMRLSDVLSTAETIHVDRDPASPGVVRLYAFRVDMHDHVANIRVDVDTAHGFLPSHIEARDPATAKLSLHRRVTAFERIDGTWLPVRGELLPMNRADKKIVSDNERQSIDRFWQVFEAELGSPAPEPDSLQATIAGERARQRVFGGTWPPSPRAAAPVLLTSLTVHSVNREIDPAVFSVSAGPHGGFFDGFDDVDGDGRITLDPEAEAAAAGQDKTRVAAAPARIGRQPVTLISSPDEILGELAADGPEITGPAMPGDRVVRTYRLTNASNRPLRVSCPEKSCGCASVEFPERLAPGEQGVVSISLIAAPVSMAQVQHAVIQLEPAAAPPENASDASVGKAVISVGYLPGGTYMPYPDVLYLHTFAGEELRTDVRMIRTSAAPLQIGSIECTIPQLRLVGRRLSQRNKYVEIADFAGVIPDAGNYFGWVNIRPKASSEVAIEDDPDARQVRIIIAVHEPWAGYPAGVTIKRGDAQEAAGATTQQVIELRRHSAVAGRPVRLVMPEIPGVAAHLEGVDATRGRVAVSVDQAKLPTPHGTFDIKAMDEHGRCMATLPVSWITLDAIPFGAAEPGPWGSTPPSR